MRATYLKSLILLCRNFLMFQGRSLWPSMSGVSCNKRSARRRRSCKGAPGGARSARGPATHAVPATSTKIATQHQRRCHKDNPTHYLFQNLRDKLKHILWLNQIFKCLFKYSSDCFEKGAVSNKITCREWGIILICYLRTEMVER